MHLIIIKCIGQESTAKLGLGTKYKKVAIKV